MDELAKLRKTTPLNEVFIIKGNHDGIDPRVPYFRFLNHVPWIRVFTEPTALTYVDKRVVVLPHTRDFVNDWGDVDLDSAQFILMHATVAGARSESGVGLESELTADLFAGLRGKILAGDVHVPQRVGKVEYVGAPYPVRFGDSFTGRAIAFPLGKRVDVPLPNIQKAKLTLTHASEIKEQGKSLRQGDMLKVELALRESELGEWQEQKQLILRWCQKRGVVLAGVSLSRKEVKKMRPVLLKATKQESHVDVLRRYCKQQGVDPAMFEIGRELLEEEDE